LRSLNSGVSQYDGEDEEAPSPFSISDIEEGSDDRESLGQKEETLHSKFTAKINELEK